MGERRAPRIDKKIDVKATVHIEFKKQIYKMAEISDVSVMNFMDIMLKHALKSKRILDELSPHFIRSVRFKNVLYPGHRKAEHIGDSETGVNYVRIKTRLTVDTFEDMKLIADGLDVKPARACAILIHEAFHSQYFIDGYVKKYLGQNITDDQLIKLKEIMEYINRDINYNLNWGTLLSYIVQEVKEPAKNIKEKVNSFVINHWKDK